MFPFSLPPLARDSGVTADFVPDFPPLWEPSGTPFIPDWTAATTAPAYGNATVDGFLWDLGPMRWYAFKITMGSTTTYGTGAWRFGLPGQAAGPSNRLWIAHAMVDQAGAGEINGVGWINAAASTARVDSIRVEATPSTTIQSNNPQAWASGDILAVNGWFLRDGI